MQLYLVNDPLIDAAVEIIHGIEFFAVIKGTGRNAISPNRKPCQAISDSCCTRRLVSGLWRLRGSNRKQQAQKRILRAQCCSTSHSLIGWDSAREKRSNYETQDPSSGYSISELQKTEFLLNLEVSREGATGDSNVTRGYTPLEKNLGDTEVTKCGKLARANLIVPQLHPLPRPSSLSATIAPHELEMAPIIHYVAFPVAASHDLAQFKEAFRLLGKADGHISAERGSSIALSKVYKLLKKAPKTYISSPKFGEISLVQQDNDIAKQFRPLKDAMSAAGDNLVRYHFHLVKGTAIPALESKTTEFALITPKKEASFESVSKLGLKVRDVWDSNGHPAAFATGEENHDLILIIVGWPSTTYHLDTVKSDPYVSIVNEFAQVGTFDITHANLERNN
ncbi:hypothetical protein GG344DRAFT_63054 [Lentinula edodes]|nr:hypothetical protein GG344DRAFT_63054 [Lentinula edodes]